eukprot:jgi/Ulvmu1/12795/UM097_0022.1
MMQAVSVDDLLSPMLNNDLEGYYADVIAAVQKSVVGSDTAEGFRVCLDVGDGKGKGLVATRSWEADEEVLRESPYVAVQSSESRKQVLACGNCFRFVGSVELQVAWRLMAVLEADPGLSDAARAEMSARVADLLSGALRLPFEHLCSLPAAVFCPNGCPAVYCCSRCAAEAWQRGHCLLCTAAAAAPRDAHLRSLRSCPYVRPFDAAALQKFGHDRSVFGWMIEAAGGTAHGAQHAAQPASPSTIPVALAALQLSPADPRRKWGLPWPPWLATRGTPEVAEQLHDYAEQLEMGSVLLAAHVLANTLCTAQHCVWILRHGGDGCGPVCAHEAAALMMAASACPQGCGHISDRMLFQLCLMAAWRPIKAAMKRPLHECTTPPDGVAPADYHNHVGVVIENCARLYRGCMHDARADALFEPAVASHLLGMFELNCLGITVESPVEDVADEMRAALKRATAGAAPGTVAQLRRTKALLGMLGSVDMPCEGSAFYVVQSCLNHDSDPNCSCQKDVEDRDGAAVLTTMRPVHVNEELTISYVGQVSDHDSPRLQATLREYGIHAR